MHGISRREFIASAALALVPSRLHAETSVPERWPAKRAAAWAAAQPWRVGCNYIPSSAVNQLEMWQAGTFDPDRIDRELGWATGLGLNAVRVFLHDLAWQQDAAGFGARVDIFLAIAARHGIATLLVFFDSCWDPFPHPGAQPPPRPGVHNSRWVQSPGARALTDRAQWPRLRAYVEGVVSAFRQDDRILGWDVWNEPDNLNVGSYGDSEPPDKLAWVSELLPQVFDWACGATPVQPLTSPLWQGDWSMDDRLGPVQRIQVARSDVLSFHDYGPPDAFAARLGQLRRYGRPVLCTEYMARPLGSTVEAILPLARRGAVAAFNWGLVSGRTQTILPWSTWQHAAGDEPALWFHDLLRPDGAPYDPAEAATLRRASSIRAKSTRYMSASPPLR